MFSRSLNKDLYGPTRISAKTGIKDILLRDHVLQQGEWHCGHEERDPWQTSFSLSFEKPGVDESFKHGRKLDVRTNVTSFMLGSEKGPLLATTAKDFDDKLQGAPVKAAPSQSTSIADFAPKYMTDRTFGKSGSVYDSVFAKKHQAHSTSAKNRAECRQHTNDLNATHFHLGTDLNGYGTETRHSFKSKLESSPEDHGSTNIAHTTAQETYKSSVFRHGDWNVAKPQSVQHSVTCNDFHIKPFSTETSGLNDVEQHVLAGEKEHVTQNESEEITVNPKDDPSHPDYQRSTHFVLGTNTNDRNSLYYKDFMLGKRECLMKPLAAPPPISSKVLPNLEDCLPPCTTNKADFVDHKTRIREIGQGRAAETQLNRERHNAPAVVLTCDVQRHPGDRQASMTGANYRPPPKDHPYLSPQKEPRSRYRYLDSDGALKKTPVWPIPSETKEEFIPIEELVSDNAAARIKEKKTDCKDRIKDNRNTHFKFGSDGNPLHTEQHDQFLSSLHLDPCLPAAGKTEGPEQKYSHVFPSESAKQGRHSVSPAAQDKVSMIQNHIQQLNQQRFLNSPDPMNIKLRKAFLEFDTSLSGSISKDNLRRVLQKLGVEINEVTFENLLELCDPNHTGFIDYQEFAKHLTKDIPLSQGTKPLASSVMKADYCPIEQRRLTSAQLRTIDKAKRIVPLSVSSHYFHKHHTGAPRLTTTGQDFVRPDRMPGTPRLSAR